MDLFLIVLGILCQCLGPVLHIVGIATHEWSVERVSNKEYGLFKQCEYKSSCESYGSGEGAVKAAAAFAIIGLIFLVVALITAILEARKVKEGCMALTELITGVIGIICIVLCLIIWGTGKHESDTMCLGYSFALSCAGGMVCLLGTVCAYLAERVDRKKEESSNQ